MYRFCLVGWLLLLTMLNGCGPAKPKIADEFVEQIGMHGVCEEDHASKSAEYYAVGYRMRARATGELYSEGFAFRRPPSVEEIVHTVQIPEQDPEQYQPPQEVIFSGSLGDFKRERLILHGFASRKCPERAGENGSDDDQDCGLGYSATCELTVEMRGSKAELDKWADDRLGLKNIPSAKGR